MQNWVKHGRETLHPSKFMVVSLDCNDQRDWLLFGNFIQLYGLLNIVIFQNKIARLQSVSNFPASILYQRRHENDVGLSTKDRFLSAGFLRTRLLSGRLLAEGYYRQEKKYRKKLG